MSDLKTTAKERQRVEDCLRDRSNVATTDFVLRLLADLRTLETQLAQDDATIFVMYGGAYRRGDPLLEQISDACARHVANQTRQQAATQENGE